MLKHNSTSYISRHTVLYYSYQNGRIAIGEFSFGEVYVYDGNGNTARCTVVDASGNALAEYRYEYDSLGRLIRSTQLDGDLHPPAHRAPLRRRQPPHQAELSNR